MEWVGVSEVAGALLGDPVAVQAARAGALAAREAFRPEVLEAASRAVVSREVWVGACLTPAQTPVSIFTSAV